MRVCGSRRSLALDGDPTAHDSNRSPYLSESSYAYLALVLLVSESGALFKALTYDLVCSPSPVLYHATMCLLG